MKLEKHILIGILILVLISLVGCEGAPIVPKQTTPGTFKEISFDFGKEVETKQFKSEKELLSFITDNSGGTSGYFGVVASRSMDDEVMAEASESLAIPAKAGGEARDFSETDIQVSGVDEADIIKTDGNYIYTVSGNVLFIVKAYPGEGAEIVSTIKLDQRPESLFINEDYLAVFGNFHDNDYFKQINFRPRYGMTYLNIYDINDKENPKLVKEYKFEGSYFRGRMTNRYMYILTSTRPEYRPIPMPIIIEDTIQRPIPIGDISYYNVPYDDPMFVNIHAINLEDQDISSKAIVVEGSQNLYMSAENIYVTYTERINEYELQMEITMELLEPKLTDVDKELIDKIKKTDNQVLSRREKQSKIFAIYQSYLQYLTSEEQDELQDKVEERLKKKLADYNYLEFTVINKVNVDKDTIKPTAK